MSYYGALAGAVGIMIHPKTKTPCLVSIGHAHGLVYYAGVFHEVWGPDFRADLHEDHIRESFEPIKGRAREILRAFMKRF